MSYSNRPSIHKRTQVQSIYSDRLQLTKDVVWFHTEGFGGMVIREEVKGASN